MIYYSYTKVLYLQNILGLVSNEYDLVAKEIELPLHEAKAFIEKWAERYNLSDTPQQTYKRRLKGEAVFSLSVHVGAVRIGTEANLYSWISDTVKPVDDLDVTTFKPDDPYLVKVRLRLFCRTSDVFLYDEDKGVLKKNNAEDLQLINQKIFYQTPSAEKFIPVKDAKISIYQYELVQITKPKKSAKDLKEQNWKHQPHATDWTWRLNEEAYKKQLEQGHRVVLRYQNYVNKPLDVKTAYFEKHLKALEGYIGFRGVRQQIGEIFHAERRIFQKKYNESWYANGARTLVLPYVKKHKQHPSSTEDIATALQICANALSKQLYKTYKAWLSQKIAEESSSVEQKSEDLS